MKLLFIIISVFGNNIYTPLTLEDGNAYQGFTGFEYRGLFSTAITPQYYKELVDRHGGSRNYLNSYVAGIERLSMIPAIQDNELNYFEEEEGKTHIVVGAVDTPAVADGDPVTITLDTDSLLNDRPYLRPNDLVEAGVGTLPTPQMGIVTSLTQAGANDWKAVITPQSGQKGDFTTLQAGDVFVVSGNAWNPEASTSTSLAKYYLQFSARSHIVKDTFTYSPETTGTQYYVTGSGDGNITAYQLSNEMEERMMMHKENIYFKSAVNDLNIEAATQTYNTPYYTTSGLLAEISKKGITQTYDSTIGVPDTIFAEVGDHLNNEGFGNPHVIVFTGKKGIGLIEELGVTRTSNAGWAGNEQLVKSVSENYSRATTEWQNKDDVELMLSQAYYHWEHSGTHFHFIQLDSWNDVANSGHDSLQYNIGFLFIPLDGTAEIKRGNSEESAIVSHVPYQFMTYRKRQTPNQPDYGYIYNEIRGSENSGVISNSYETSSHNISCEIFYIFMATNYGYYLQAERV